MKVLDFEVATVTLIFVLDHKEFLFMIWAYSDEYLMHIFLSLQLRNHNRVKAPTAERAASLLDAAIAARRHTDFITYLCHSSIMFFTLYVQPPRTESSTIGKG